MLDVASENGHGTDADTERKERLAESGEDHLPYPSLLQFREIGLEPIME